MPSLKIVERRDIDVILEILNEENDKIMHSVILFKLKRDKNVRGRNVRCSGYGWFVFRERRTSFSLNFWLIRPSEFFGARRKVALCSKAYAWAPILRSFDKLCEVWVLSYLFYPLFKSFVDVSVGLSA